MKIRPIECCAQSQFIASKRRLLLYLLLLRYIFYSVLSLQNQYCTSQGRAAFVIHRFESNKSSWITFTISVYLDFVKTSYVDERLLPKEKYDRISIRLNYFYVVYFGLKHLSPIVVSILNYVQRIVYSIITREHYFLLVKGVTFRCFNEAVSCAECIAR